MPFLELTITIAHGERERIEEALERAGALSVTLMDADADTPDEEAIFEPAVGAMPLWREITLAALFEPDTERSGLLAALDGVLPGAEAARIAFREVADQDWTRVWMEDYRPMRFGRRLWVYPWNIEPPADDAEAVIVRIDPGLAFGTGTHPTTALCLEWLDAQDLAGRSLVDYGCGSGILAIAALKLGAGGVTGIDNDPQALLASADNATRNGVEGRLTLALPGEAPEAAADFLVANILAGPLGELAPRFAASLKPGGAFALSGILDGQQEELRARYAADFDDVAVTIRDGWVRLAGRRRATAEGSPASPDSG